jgi:anti-sigma factor RsiW
MHDSNCQALLHQLSAFVEDEASPQLCQEIERHLASCANCRIVVDTLDRTISLYHTLPAPEMSEEVQIRLHHRLRII